MVVSAVRAALGFAYAAYCSCLYAVEVAWHFAYGMLVRTGIVLTLAALVWLVFSGQSPEAIAGAIQAQSHALTDYIAAFAALLRVALLLAFLWTVAIFMCSRSVPDTLGYGKRGSDAVREAYALLRSHSRVSS